MSNFLMKLSGRGRSTDAGLQCRGFFTQRRAGAAEASAASRGAARSTPGALRAAARG